MKINRLPLALAILISINFGCKKYLDKKPDQELHTIESIADMQALLDYNLRINFNDVSALNVVSDDYFLSDAVFNARPEQDRNLYLWAGANVFAQSYNAWTAAYETVYITNVVLDACKLNRGKLEDSGLDQIQAQALFFRARTFLNIIGVWTPAYEKTTVDQVLGIPLRLNANFNEISQRASLSESFAQVVSDLKKAAALLPAKAISPVRASKAAAYGILSRAYLQMGNYKNAGAYADSSLQINNSLMDYNTLNTVASFPIDQLNEEVSFESRAAFAGPISQTRSLINPELYALYEANDLRKLIFFKASGTNLVFKGYYAGAVGLFDGVAVDELLLTRAESYAHTGKEASALADLNRLLKKRYVTGAFTDLQLTGAALLDRIKQERRKELLFRSIRWTDIKRWNKEGDQITLRRTVNGTTSSLPPNSLRYAIAIPDDVLELSGMAQNPR